jgi:hypothetical protein
VDELGSLAFFLLPVASGLALGLVVGRRVRGAGFFAAAILLPLGLLAATVFAKDVIWDPDNGCSEECWGVVIYGIWWAGATIGAEIGLAGGAVVRARRRRARGPRASSP